MAKGKAAASAPKTTRAGGTSSQRPADARHSLIVIAPEGTDVNSALSALAESGRIGSFAEDRGSLLRRRGAGTDPQASVAIADLDMSPDAYDADSLRRFWRGAVEADGSMSAALLSMMRMDEARRQRYEELYGDEDGYVKLHSSPWAEACLSLPSGEWDDWLSMRSPARRREWASSYAARFLTPHAGDGFVASAWTFAR